MRIIDHTTGRSLHRVGSEEEALLGLAGIAERRLTAAVHALCVCGFANGEQGAARRTVADAAAATPVLGGALFPPDGDPIGRRAWDLGSLMLEPFTPRNAAGWPVPLGELRRDPGLAGAPVGELAAQLNARLRADAAAVLAECADYRDPDGGQTLWDLVADRCDLPAATLGDVVVALRSGGRCWEALSGWEPAGGADGDPFLVARYRWAGLLASVKLDSHELLARCLAAEADLALYRTVIDAGGGRTEFIWPAQRFVCCGRDWPLAGGDRIPVWTAQWADRDSRWGRPGALLVAQGVQCMICGAVSYPSWLTRRDVPDHTGPLAVIEPLDDLPAETLAAAAAHGLAAVTSNHPPGDR